MQIAVRDSVTVSMAALTNGIFNRIVRVRCVPISTSLGNTSEKAGTSNTSSKVKRSSISIRWFPIVSPSLPSSNFDLIYQTNLHLSTLRYQSPPGSNSVPIIFYRPPEKTSRDFQGGGLK